ncbi:hypothetical protein PV326_001577 [Microctonus aethiopoides]|nr:hypothetical protein PV326_001577 [Microctonus aethiopoides]
MSNINKTYCSTAYGHPEPPDHLDIQIERPVCGETLLHLVRIKSVLANENLPLFATSKKRGPKYIELDKKKIMNEVGEFALYHDYKTRSAFVYFRETGLLNGIVNVVFHVEGLPITDLDKVQKVGSTNSKYFKWLFSKKSLKISRRLRSTNETNTTKIRTRREDSDYVPVVYPELLVAISYDMFKSFGKDFRKTISHILTVYNGVDMLYKPVQTVDVRINIAAIVFELTKDYWSFIPKIKIGRKVKIDHTAVNLGLSDYFKNHEDYFPRDSYDYIAYNTKHLITNDLRNRNSHGVALSHDPNLVFPFDNENRYKRLNMAVRDYKGYESYRAIAHELAHIFNAKHDEDEKGFDTPSCSSSGSSCTRSSIMASDCSKLSLDWSEYTEVEFTDFFSSPFSCNLKNYPLSLFPSPRKPRVVLMGVDQCECYGYYEFIKPESYTPDWCKEPIHCIDARNRVVDDLPLPFDGTPCGSFKVCWEKSCVENESGSLV